MSLLRCNYLVVVINFDILVVTQIRKHTAEALLTLRSMVCTLCMVLDRTTAGGGCFSMWPSCTVNAERTRAATRQGTPLVGSARSFRTCPMAMLFCLPGFPTGSQYSTLEWACMPPHAYSTHGSVWPTLPDSLRWDWDVCYGGGVRPIFVRLLA